MAAYEVGGSGASRLRAAAFLRRLDRMLDERPVVERDSVGHTVWVLGAIGYRVNRSLPGVYPVHRDKDGRVHVGGYTVELFRPLRTQDFLSFVLRRLGQSSGPQRELFRSPAEIAMEEYRLVCEAWRRLRRDSRFEDLRSRRLPAALGLDPVLCAITLQARRSLTSRIASDEYSLVWRHERALRVVARENPGLLPFVAVALKEQRILPYGDAVKELHLLFRCAKLAPATWRWISRHGCRVLRPVWARSREGGLVGSALEFLREIERAGYPAPPPAWGVSAWLDSAVGSRLNLDRGWNPVPPAVVRVGLAAARRARGSSGEAFLEEDLRLVFEWAAREAPVLDKLQRRAGWAWLLRRAMERERRRLLLEVEGPRSWPCAVREVVGGEFVASAVDTVEGLVDEGMAFHNCIAGYAEYCQRSEMRIFAVRARASGRRLGVIRLDHQPFSEGWQLRDVLGIANAPVGSALRRFAEDLADRYNELMGGFPHESEGWSLGFGDELAQLDED